MRLLLPGGRLPLKEPGQYSDSAGGGGENRWRVDICWTALAGTGRRIYTILIQSCLFDALVFFLFFFSFGDVYVKHFVARVRACFCCAASSWEDSLQIESESKLRKSKRWILERSF